MDVVSISPLSSPSFCFNDSSINLCVKRTDVILMASEILDQDPNLLPEDRLLYYLLPADRLLIYFRLTCGVEIVYSTVMVWSAVKLVLYLPK